MSADIESTPCERSHELTLTDSEKWAFTRGVYALAGALTSSPVGLHVGANVEVHNTMDRVVDFLRRRNLLDVEPFPKCVECSAVLRSPQSGKPTDEPCEAAV